MSYILFPYYQYIAEVTYIILLYFYNIIYIICITSAHQRRSHRQGARKGGSRGRIEDAVMWRDLTCSVWILNFFKEKLFHQNQKKLNFNRTFEQKMKPNMYIIPVYIGNMETKYSSFPPYYEKCPANYEKIWHIKSLYYGGNENLSFSP